MPTGRRAPPTIFCGRDDIANCCDYCVVAAGVLQCKSSIAMFENLIKISDEPCAYDRGITSASSNDSGRRLSRLKVIRSAKRHLLAGANRVIAHGVKRHSQNQCFDVPEIGSALSIADACGRRRPVKSRRSVVYGNQRNAVPVPPNRAL